MSSGEPTSIVERALVWELHKPAKTSGFTLTEHAATSQGVLHFALPEEIIAHLVGRMLNQTSDGPQRLLSLMKDVENEIAHRTALRLKGKST